MVSSDSRFGSVTEGAGGVTVVFCFAPMGLLGANEGLFCAADGLLGATEGRFFVTGGLLCVTIGLFVAILGHVWGAASGLGDANFWAFMGCFNEGYIFLMISRFLRL